MISIIFCDEREFVDELIHCYHRHGLEEIGPRIQIDIVDYKMLILHRVSLWR